MKSLDCVKVRGDLNVRGPESLSSVKVRKVRVRRLENLYSVKIKVT